MIEPVTIANALKDQFIFQLDKRRAYCCRITDNY